MKRYRWWLIAGAFVALLSIGVLNFVLDANHLYLARSQVFYAHVVSYVDRLLISKDGLIQFPYERPFKIELARRAPAECAVTGSSHEMQFAIDNFYPAHDCRSLVNLGVSGGSFEEFLIFAEILARRSETKKIFIGVGPWMFRKGASARWVESPDEYAEATRYFDLNDRSVWSGVEAKVSNIFNLQYLLVGLQNLFQSKPGPTTFGAFDINGRTTATAITKPDGALIYSNEYEEQSGHNPIGRGTYMLGEPPVDSNVLRDFGLVLGVLKAKNITPVLVLTPYHPDVFACRSELACRTLQEVEFAVRKLGAQNGIEVIGSYNPKSLGLEAGDFYDDMHLRDTGIRKM